MLWDSVVQHNTIRHLTQAISDGQEHFLITAVKTCSGCLRKLSSSETWRVEMRMIRCTCGAKAKHHSMRIHVWNRQRLCCNGRTSV